MPAPNQAKFIGPTRIEIAAQRLYDNIIDIGERDEDDAIIAAKQAEYAIRTFIEERNPKPMAQNTVKVIKGNQTYTREATQPTALSEIERLAERRAKDRGITVPQAYAEVLNEKPQLYDQYTAELAAGVYAQPIATAEPAPQSKTPASDLMLATARGYVETGNEKNIADALMRVARESPILYEAYVKESRNL